MKCICGSGHAWKDCCAVMPRILRNRFIDHFRMVNQTEMIELDANDKEAVWAFADPRLTTCDEETYRIVMSEMDSDNMGVYDFWLLDQRPRLSACPTQRQINDYFRTVQQDKGISTWEGLHEYDDGVLVNAMRNRYYTIPAKPFPVIFRKQTERSTLPSFDYVDDKTIYSERLGRVVSLPLIYHHEDLDTFSTTWSFPHELVHVVQRIGRHERSVTYPSPIPYENQIYRNPECRVHQLVLDELDVIDVLRNAYGQAFKAAYEDPYSAAIHNAMREGAKFDEKSIDAGLSKINWIDYESRFGTGGRKRIRDALSGVNST